MAVYSQADLASGADLTLIASGSITQDANITAHNVTASAGSNITMGLTAATTTPTGGSVFYEAGGNIAVATISAASGVVTLKVATTGGISDSNNDAQVNITANALNIIGHGVVNTSAKPDDQTIAALRSQAIETKVDRAYVASYSAAAKLDYQIGQNVTGVLRENNGWAVQFVNNGFFVPVKAFVPSATSAGTSVKSVDSWQYTRDLNFQLLEYLAAKSDVVRTSTSVGKSVSDLVLFKQTARPADVELKRTYPVLDSGMNVDVRTSDQFNIDVLGIDSSGIIPTFGTAAFDQMVVKGGYEPLQFEYWIENMMF